MYSNYFLRNELDSLLTEPMVSWRKSFFQEGISHSRMYLKEGEESAEDIIDSVCAGVRSACTYTGARTLQELYDRAMIGVQTPAGYKEGRPVLERW